MKILKKESILGGSAVPKIILTLLLPLLWAAPAFAHISPPGCTGSGLGINLFTSQPQVHLGDVVNYSVVVFNGSGFGPTVCDATGITASIVTPDGVNHPISLVRTSLSNGQFDSYPNVVSYTAQAANMTPAGTLNATASDTGSIHQNVVDSTGGGNQGLNVFVLSDLHVIKVVNNTGGGTAVPSDFNIHVKTGGTDMAGSPAVGTGSPGTLFTPIAGTYTVSEDVNASYTPSFSGDCDVSGNVTISGGDNKTCTVTNTFIPPATLHIIKLVVNTGGGTAVASDFNLHVKNIGVDVGGSPAVGVAGSGTLYTLVAGTYVVSEDANASYTTSFSGDCSLIGSVTLTPGVDRTCTVTNTFIPPATLHIIKLVVNTGGGTAVASDFNLHVKTGGVDVAGSPAVGVAGSGTSYTLGAGTYVVSEDANPLYAQVFSGDCNLIGSITLVPSADKICTITNAYIPPLPATINVVKVVINDNGRTKVVSDFPLFVNGTLIVSGATNVFASGSYAVTETSDPNYTQTFSGDCDVTGHLSLLAGNNKFCIVTNNDIPIPSSGGGSGPILLPPLIDVVKVPNPLTLPGGPGPVTYTYTIRNIGVVPITTVTMIGDSCRPIVYVSGDTNNNSILDITETWSYTCTTTVTSTHTNIVTATGSANGITATDFASATVVVGIPGVVPPLIHVTKVPSPLTLPVGGGMVTYSYAITNPGTLPLNNVQLTDNKCAPVTFVSGDTNNNSLLDTDETWTYTCQTNLAVSTVNTASAQGSANGLTVRDIAIATVLVPVPGFPNTGGPGFPNTGFSPKGKNIPWDVVILSFVLMLVSGSILVLKKPTI